MYKLLSEIVPGDSFVFGGKTTNVINVERDICKHKVHINKSDCYEPFTEVLVKNA